MQQKIKKCDIILSYKNSIKENEMSNSIKFIDLFAGIGGIRKGFENACEELGLKTECVLTSEIKEHAIKILKQNHPDETIEGDITKIDTKSIKDFDFLLAGFPCQPFSSAGKRLGFSDTRGTMFFEVERILRDKKPFGFVLENVEGLVNHDKEKPSDKIGRTLLTIINSLEALGYKTDWKVLNAKYFGVPQERKRIYIIGTKKEKPIFNEQEPVIKKLSSIIEHGLQTQTSPFIELLLSHYDLSELNGKSIKDKRGGKDNIHSWDIDLKGKTTKTEKEFLNILLKERRKKKWAEEFGIDWMDGMPLTIEQIKTFWKKPNLEKMLEKLVKQKYLVMEHPKRLVNNHRVEDSDLPIGYNIVAGKMSFEINKILSPDSFAPTLVAMDAEHLFVVDNDGLRNLSLKEGLRLFGYPDDYKFKIDKAEGFDLLGNTVVVPVITYVSKIVLEIYRKYQK